MESLNLKKCCDQLLEMGKRNKLLYFSYGRSYLETKLPDSSSLFASLLAGKKLSFYDFDKLLRNSNVTNDESFDEKKDSLFDLAKSELTNKEILCLPSDYSHSVRKLLKTLFTNAGASLDERGINTLYLAFGFLRYADVEDPSTLVTAPLVLMPVVLAKEEQTFSIEMLEGEDLVINTSLAYKLKSVFNIDLPSFEEEDNLDSYLEKVNNLIYKEGTWSTNFKSALGLFSFAKLDMYKDLSLHESEVLTNPLIEELFTGKNQNEEEDNEENDLKKWEGELHNVTDADSSQMKAIVASKNRNGSFVLQGPPGTGKSQTITNIIAEALFDGKKVLFVSEKMAALNVVYKKLTAAGLGSFCLELHSRKCNKKLVAQEILNTLNQNHIALLETANEKVADYNYYRSYLNQYDQELNRKIKGIDLSPYELMGRGDKYQVAQDVNFYFPDIASTDQTYLDKALDNLKKYLYLVKIVGTNYLSNPLINYVSSDSYADTACFKEKTQEAQDSLLKLISSNYDFLIKEFSLTEIPLHDLKDMVKALLQVQKVSTYSGLITSSDKRTAIKKEVKDYLALKKEKEDFDSKLEKHIQKPYYHDPKLQVKSIDFITKYQNPFLRLSKDYRQIKQAFKARKFKTSKANYKEMCVAFQSLEDYLNKEDLLTTGRKSLLHHLDAYQDDDQEFSSLQKDLSLLSRITSPSVLKYLSNLSEPSFLFLQSSNQLESYPLTSIDNLNAYGQFFKEGYLSEENLNAIHQDIDIIQSTIDKLSSFCQLQATINEAKKDKYDAFISAYLPFLQKEDLTKSGLIDSFKKVFYCQWSDYALKNNPFLSQVSSFKHGEIAKNFIQSDKEKMKINSFDIQRAVFSRYPNMTDHSYGTIGKLKMDVSKKKGLLSIRSLLSQYREEIQQIKPCFLISPLSVSTLLDSTEHFDLVVFDEASQVFPWDALGAIYRSSQAIISGDQHQMPPTSFFLTRIDEIDEEDDVSLNQSNASDFESILDYFAAFPHYELLWHYRSRCEQLITFSNHHFYNDNLVTFPSAKKSCPGFGVDFEYVDNGVYDRKERNNPIEAQRVVDLVYDCYQNRRSKSVGVVAFNISQQDEISDGIDKLADNDPDFAKYINGDKTEPLFVKNLETVQGDERDIIILSIGYAKDSKGTFILNFGPLNKEGGERRLNVAITRAKENVIVCSSIRYSDIDLSRSYSFGTRFLHDYLYFAQTKRQNDMPSPFDAKLEFDSPFEEDVYNFLVSKQYGVDTQVGCSGYRIDMGVKNRTNSDYVLAIECDGKTYHSGKCARDRDRLRQEVLEEKGWKFYRIWSTDWFKDRRNSEENLVLAIERALKNETLKEEIIPSQKASDAIPVLAIPIAPTEKRLKDYFPKYVPYNKVLNSKGTNYSYSSIQRFLEDVVDKEQPITEKLLLRRLATYLNRQKVTSIVLNAFHEYVPYSYRIKKNEDDGSYYIDPNCYLDLLRLGGDRKVDEVPLLELQNGIIKIVEIEGRIDKNGLSHELLCLFDMSKLSDSMSSYIEAAIKEMLERQTLKEESDGSLCLNFKPSF